MTSDSTRDKIENSKKNIYHTSISAVKLAPSLLIPNVQLKISAKNCVTLTFTSTKIMIMITSPIQNYLWMLRRKISLSSTITCQESSRSSSCRRSECLSCSSPCFFETSIMIDFQITKPNKSKINPMTKFKPNQK